MENNSPSTETRNALVKDVDKLKEDVTQVAKDVRNHATARLDEVRQSVNDNVEAFQQTLTSHPLTLLGIGFAFGFFFGLRFNR
jgi:ElaB/YqjD/DUF883 family membrane-anchored ribosome-binding protein